MLDEKQLKMITPDQVLQNLIEGNKRFYSNAMLKKESLVALSRKASKEGPFPKAVILACMDSRSIPELVFDQSIADIFTLRVAGNLVNDEMRASMEFATKYVGSKLIVIMGHTQCRALQAACEGNVADTLSSLVNAFEPAIRAVKKQQPDKELDCDNEEIMTTVAIQNVRNMLGKVINESNIIQALLADGIIKIVGALHDLKSGVVTFL